MAWVVPEHLVNEQQAVEADIRAAFKGVSREGGISWSEADVIDGYGTVEERESARALDKDRTWEELIDGPRWSDFVSNWCFLDPIGFRYYIAPAMIGCSRDGHGDAVAYALTINPYREEMIGLIDETQARAIARFVRFMVATCEARDDHIDAEDWQEAQNSHWHQWGKVS